MGGSVLPFAIDSAPLSCHEESYSMTTPLCTRRQFLKTTTAAGAVVALAPFAVTRLRGANSSVPPAPTWVDKPMRWAQLTLVEDDPGKYDPAFWLDYFKRTQSDAVCLS